MHIAGASSRGARAAASAISPATSSEPGRTHQPSPAAAEARADRQPFSARAGQDKVAESSLASGEAGKPQHLEQLRLAALASRDQEVRAHEQAHAAVGGSYASAPSHTCSRGPDGKRYAVGGEVGIDVAVVPNDPQATLAKLETVMRAALAPAAPSAQDLRVAARARARMVQARAEVLVEQCEQAAAARADARSGQQGERGVTVESAPPAGEQTQASQPALELYRQLAGRTHPAHRSTWSSEQPSRCGSGNFFARMAAGGRPAGRSPRCLTRVGRKRMFQTPV